MRLLLTALLLTATTAAAETVQAGRAELTVPAGWTVQPGKVLSLVHGGDKEQAATIMVFTTTAPAEKVDANFAAFADLTSQKHFDAKFVRTGRTDKGFLGRKTIVTFRVPAKGREVRMTSTVVAVQGKTQFVGLAMLTGDSDARRKHEPTLLKLANTMTLNDAPAAQAPGRTPQDLQGLYCKFGLTVAPSPLGGTQSQATRDYLYFFPGGFVYRALPAAEQINRPSIDALKKEPQDCGVYVLAGNKLTLSFPDPDGWTEDQTTDYRPKEEGFDSGGYYHQLAPMTGKKIDGRFRYFNYVGGDGSAGTTGGVASERFLTLRPDGTYERNGVTSVGMTVEGGGGRTGIAGNKKKPVERGTYAFDRYTVTFTPDGGNPTTMTAYLTSDGMLVLDDRPFLEDKNG